MMNISPIVNSVKCTFLTRFEGSTPGTLRTKAIQKMIARIADVTASK